MIYWSRQIIGLVLGFIWGQVPFHGFVGIFLFGGLSARSSMYGSQPCRGSTKWNMAEHGNLPRRDFSPELWGPLSRRLSSSHGHVVKRRRGATR